MSALKVPSNVGRIDLGYDALIDSYFVQVRRTDATGTLHLSEWLGSGIASAECNGLIRDPEIIIRRASVYGRVPEGLAEALRAEREHDPKFVDVEHVTYIGMPTQEVWRHKAGFDSDYGMRIGVCEHEIYSWGRQVAYAILIDVLGHRLRARQLAIDFGHVIENQICKPHWLLTEADIQSGIYEVERTKNLHWMPSQLCYAGKCKAPDLSPEAQLRRAADHDEAMQPLESSRINLNRHKERAI
jgi:hypothetical protein